MENTPVPNSTTIFANTDWDLRLSETAANIFKLIIQNFVFLFGVPGNCLILCVYWTKTVKTSTQVFIMGLAWADLVVCVLTVYRIYYTAVLMAGYEPPEFDFIIWAIGTTAVATSVMMTAVIAADRYDCVCRPHGRFFTHRRGKIAAWAAFVFSLLINTPAFIPTTAATEKSLYLLQLPFQVFCFVVALVMIALCYGKVYMTIRKHTKVDAKRTNQECTVFRSANEHSMRQQDSVFINVKQNIPIIAPVSMLIRKPCSSTVADVGRMTQSKGTSSHAIGESTIHDMGTKWGSYPQTTLTKLVLSKDTESHDVLTGTSDPHQHQCNAGLPAAKADAANLQRKTTRMLFITSVVFLLTWLPYWVYVATTFASYCNPVFKLIITALYETRYINNAVNPLIYGLANRRFRKDCKTVLSKIKLCENATLANVFS